MKKLLFITLLIGFQISAFAQQKPCACCSEEHRQFDFWVGDWETVDSTGKVIGYNNIVIMQDSCIIQENWNSASSPYTGTSYNFYNTTTKKWEQLWIDNGGNPLKLKGERVGNQMILYSDIAKSQKGEDYMNRVTWTANNDGTVRQHWEVFKLSEDNWKTVFDGLYRKKK